MNAGPKRYPNADALRARFDAAGLASEFTPLYAGTPFNNWRVVASYPGNHSASHPSAAMYALWAAQALPVARRLLAAA